MFTSVHKGGIVKYQLVYGGFNKVDASATANMISAFNATIYSNPDLYNVEQKLLKRGDVNYNFSLIPILENNILIARKFSPIVHRCCLLKGQ